MTVEFTESANKDYKWWKENEPKKTERIKILLEDIKVRPLVSRNPSSLIFKATGHAELTKKTGLCIRSKAKKLSLSRVAFITN